MLPRPSCLLELGTFPGSTNSSAAPIRRSSTSLVTSQETRCLFDIGTFMCAHRTCFFTPACSSTKSMAASASSSVRKSLRSTTTCVCNAHGSASTAFLFRAYTLSHRLQKGRRVCALDPGVRNFVSLYDPDGRALAISDPDKALERRFRVLDVLKSKEALSQANRHAQWRRVDLSNDDLDDVTYMRNIRKGHRRRWRLHKDQQFVNARLRNMANDLYYKVSKYLADNYAEVLLPALPVAQFVRKEKLVPQLNRQRLLVRALSTCIFLFKLRLR
ncbi:hypothetical protein PybrP1_011607 [[Pythium] brassicae (nom. inval.)]|nr:hypothetical protein PybrP1_011607 [[Pythium] brassicae (nom. inval.)]